MQLEISYTGVEAYPISENELSNLNYASELKYSKNLFVVNETKNMRKEISETSFGFCAGGITTYEFATMNIPFAIIFQYKHQLLTAKAWEKRKIAYNLGLPSNNSNIKENFKIKRL